MAWDSEAEEYTTKDPGVFHYGEGDTAFSLPRTADTHCHHCGVGLALEMDLGEDPVEQEEPFRVRCYSCGKTHMAVYAIVPEVRDAFSQEEPST